MQLRKVVYGGFLVALSIILTRLFSFMVPIGGIGALRLGFGPVPLVFAGIVLGPTFGVLAGVAADLVGFAINPMGGAYLPQFTVISAMQALIPALMVRGRRLELLEPRDYLVICGATQLILGVIVTPLVLFQAYKVPIIVNAPLRLLTSAVLVPTYAVIIGALHRAWVAAGVRFPREGKGRG